MKVAFYKGKYGSFIDRLIMQVTGGPYSHVELVFSDNMMFSSSPRDHGVRLRPCIIDKEKWNIVELMISQEDEQIVRDFCNSQVGKKYDYLGILGFLGHICHEDKKRWFCSEIVLAALQQIGMYWQVEPSTVSPSSLYKLIH